MQGDVKEFIPLCRNVFQSLAGEVVGGAPVVESAKAWCSPAVSGFKMIYGNRFCPPYVSAVSVGLVDCIPGNMAKLFYGNRNARSINCSLNTLDLRLVFLFGDKEPKDMIDRGRKNHQPDPKAIEADSKRKGGSDEKRSQSKSPILHVGKLRARFSIQILFDIEKRKSFFVHDGRSFRRFLQSYFIMKAAECQAKKPPREVLFANRLSNGILRYTIQFRK